MSNLSRNIFLAARKPERSDLIEVLSVPLQAERTSGIVLFNVTRYNKYMSKTVRKRGRPKKANAKSAAERMRAYRKRKRDAGLANVRRWEPAGPHTWKRP